MGLPPGPARSHSGDERAHHDRCTDHHGGQREVARQGGGDADGDGLTNLSEYLAGTDPGDAASALRLTTVNLANSKMSLVFEASQGRLIEIQSTPALGQAAWKSVLEVDVKSDGPQQVEVDLPVGEAQFFRLLLVE